MQWNIIQLLHLNEINMRFYEAEYNNIERGELFNIVVHCSIEPYWSSSSVVIVLLHKSLFDSNFEILWKLWNFWNFYHFEFFLNLMKFLKFYENFEFKKKNEILRNFWNFEFLFKILNFFFILKSYEIF